jgi:hypothetical protein
MIQQDRQITAILKKKLQQDNQKKKKLNKLCKKNWDRLKEDEAKQILNSPQNGKPKTALHLELNLKAWPHSKKVYCWIPYKQLDRIGRTSWILGNQHRVDIDTRSSEGNKTHHD